jgi:hypothetical protein
MNAKLGLFAATTLMGLLLAACGPSYTAVRVGPPPPRPAAVGYVGVAPGPGYVWTDGYWDLRGSNWYWVNGRWLRPPRPHTTWVPGYWAPRQGRYHWHPGRWRR